MESLGGVFWDLHAEDTLPSPSPHLQDQPHGSDQGPGKSYAAVFPRPFHSRLGHWKSLLQKNLARLRGIT